MREFKGKSLLELPDDYIVIDIETTDFDYFYGDIIELCAIKYRNHNVVEVFETFIKPINGIPQHIIDLTGITETDVASAPSIDNISKDFLNFLSDDILIGHNVNFDINFLYDALKEVGIYLKNDFVDTLRLSRILQNETENHKLLTLCKHYKIAQPNHRSREDVIATNELYLVLKSLHLETPEKLYNFINRKQKRTYVRQDLSLVEATVDPEDIDENHIFFNKSFSFTGRMDFLTKKSAALIVANLGGFNLNNVTAKTDYLILGNLDYQHQRFGKKSSKHLKAEAMQEKGHDIEIMTEITFLEIINNLQ